MELSAALAADLATLTAALDDTDTDLAQTVRQLATAASTAVGSYLGLTITATTGGRPINLTALADLAETDDILTSLRVPLDVAASPLVDGHPGSAIAGATIELILYAGKPGALVDLAADLSWLTGRDLTDFVLDADLVVADHDDELGRTSWVNQAIGVLIGRGFTPELAAREIDSLPSQTEQDRRRSGHRLFTGLHAPDPRST